MSKSPTARALEKAELYRVRPPADADDRPLPHADDYEAELSAMFNAIAEIFADTRLEPESEDLQWAFVNVFHRKAQRLEELLERNEIEQRTLQRQQDGSEVKSVELERLTHRGMNLVEDRNCLQAMRDYLADLYAADTGKPWTPRQGSRVSTHARTTTAAMIDSRDFVAAQARERNAVRNPAGTRVVLTGGTDYADLTSIYEALDDAHRRYPDMVLLHSGCQKGAELIAAKWAKTRGVTQIVFKPDWHVFKRSAPFKRNDQLIAAGLVLVIACPGSGVSENLVDKARQQGIPIHRIVAA
jgi:SLOG family YspA-like protein